MLALVSLVSHGQQPAPQDSPAQLAEIQFALDAKDAMEAKERFETLFKNTSDERLRRLKGHPHDGIALRAAWEEVRLSFPAQAKPKAASPDQKLLQRFVGFLKGRLRTELPVWWLEMLLEAKAYRRDHVSLPWPPDLRTVHYHEQGPFWVPRNTTLVKNEGKMILTIERKSVAIAEKNITEAQDSIGAEFACAAFDSRRCYLALYENCGCSFPLLGIARASGNVTWKAKVWATDLTGRYTGQHLQRAMVQVEADRILVFGAGNNGAYVEAFSAETGKNLFRFSTSY
jgi:hypothetical protein